MNVIGVGGRAARFLHDAFGVPNQIERLSSRASVVSQQGLHVAADEEPLHMSRLRGQECLEEQPLPADVQAEELTRLGFRLLFL